MDLQFRQSNGILRSIVVESQRNPVSVAFRENGLGLLESHHEEGFFMDWRQDAFPKILFIIGGEGTIHRPGGIFAIRANTVIVVPSNMDHRLVDTPGRPLSLYGLCLKDPSFPGKTLMESACGHWRLEDQPDLVRRLLSWLRAILSEEREPRAGSADNQLAFLCRILVMLARTPAHLHSQTMDSRARITAYIDKVRHEFWKNEDLDQVARSLGLSRRRFTQLFREETGSSWLVYLKERRLSHARDLLQMTKLSIRAVAFECGYADLAHFYRVFKQAHECSPGQYREQVE